MTNEAEGAGRAAAMAEASTAPEASIADPQTH